MLGCFSAGKTKGVELQRRPIALWTKKKALQLRKMLSGHGISSSADEVLAPKSIFKFSLFFTPSVRHSLDKARQVPVFGGCPISLTAHTCNSFAEMEALIL
jgi:hypothetical protein